MSTVEWSDLAILDLQAIDDCWSAYDEASVERVADMVEAASEFLAMMPRTGPALRRSDARKWLVRSTPYLSIYRVLDHRIEVLRVRRQREEDGNGA